MWDYRFTCNLHNIIFRAAYFLLDVLEYLGEPKGGQKEDRLLPLFTAIHTHVVFPRGAAKALLAIRSMPGADDWC